MISFSIKKIKIQLHITFFIFMAIMIALNYIEQFFIMFFTVTLHELTHVITAAFFGLKLEKISVMPIGEVASIKDLPYLNCFKKIIVMLSGPLINLLLYLITGWLFGDKFEMFRVFNLYICIFNLLPIYPLDGSKILNAVLANKIGIIPSNKLIFKMSKFLSYLVIIIGFAQVILFPFNISLLLIGLYMNSIAGQDYLNIILEFFSGIMRADYKIKTEKMLLLKKIVVNDQTKIKDMLYKVCWEYYYIFCIIHDGHIEKYITEQELFNYISENGLNGRVEDLMTM